MSKKIKIINDKVLIIKTEELELKNKNVQALRKEFRLELSNIVRQIKSLKSRAGQIKIILQDLEEK